MPCGCGQVDIVFVDWRSSRPTYWFLFSRCIDHTDDRENDDRCV